MSNESNERETGKREREANEDNDDDDVDNFSRPRKEVAVLPQGRDVTKKELQEGFNDLSRAKLPGTMNGFGENLSVHVEDYINRLIRQVQERDGFNEPRIDVLHKDNDLPKKLTYLYGRQPETLYTEEGELLEFMLDDPVLDDDTFRLLLKFRDQRVAHVHSKGPSVYDQIRRFKTLRIKISDQCWCTFTPEGHTLMFAWGHKVPYSTIKGGLTFHRPPLAPAFNLVPSDAHNSDLIMLLHSKLDAEKHYSNEIQALGGAIPRGTIHLLVLLWGQEKFFFSLNESASKNMLEKCIDFRTLNKQMCYFSLQPYETLLKIIQSDYE
jgi:hypothetical protein